MTAALDVQLIPAFKDNYIYLLCDSGRQAVGIVDPGDADPAIAVLETQGLVPTHIFNTHHHPDHSGGNGALKARYPTAKLVAPASETARIADIDVPVAEGDIVPFGTITFRVMEVPGHTRGHIALWSPDGEAVFSGDTLFAIGCGRMFEGTAHQMWNSLSRLAALPPETRVYCGHEYTEANARFALTVDGGNPDLIRRAEEVRQLRAQGLPTIPSTIALECRINPFLRAAEPALATSVGLAGHDPVAVFAEIRGQKDRF